VSNDLIVSLNKYNTKRMRETSTKSTMLSVKKKKARKFQNLNSDHIKASRIAIGWNQQKLADAAGISISTLKRLEALGAQSASMVTIDKLVAALVKGGAVDRLRAAAEELNSGLLAASAHKGYGE
jgi:hypothetical protein